MKFFFVFITVLSFWCLVNCAGNDKEAQNQIKDIRKELFQTRAYDQMARPVLNYTHSTNVSISLGIDYIIDLDVQTNVLESIGWIYLTWYDENLQWEPTKYAGIDEIRVRADEVFRSDITIVNSVESENIVRTSTHDDLILSSSGKIMWGLAMPVKTICQVDLTEWPFDRQNCQYQLMSWTYEASALHLINLADDINLYDFKNSPEWMAVDSKCEYKLHDYGEQQKFPEVSCWLIIERQTTIYRYTVYFPVLCALLINLMTLFLNIRNHLRFYLSSLSFVTLLFIILYLGNKLGFGSLGKPKVVVYLGQMLVLVTVTMLWSAFAFNFAKSTFELPPNVMRALEPMHHWLVRSDIESAPLTQFDAEGQLENVTEPNKQSNNLIVIQVVDKVLFALFLILIIVLHN